MRVVTLQKPKWTRKAHKKMVEDLKAEGKDYKQEKLKKRVAALQAKVGPVHKLAGAAEQQQQQWWWYNRSSSSSSRVQQSRTDQA